MTRYYPGLNDALATVNDADEQACLRHLDALYGRDNLKYGASLEDLREEVRAQMRRDFTDTSQESKEDRAWIEGMGKAAREGRY